MEKKTKKELEAAADASFAALAAEPEKEAKQEIFPGITTEEIKAVFFNADALREPPYRIYQLNTESYRYYYRFDENGDPVFYPSVTTLLRQVMPTSPFLIKWMLENGKEQADEKRDLAAAYGTFMHIQFERLIINRKVNFDTMPAELLDYMQRENLPEKVFTEWIGKIRKDILSFAQFVKDYKVRALAIEIGLAHPEYHFAGCIDLPCIMADPQTGKDFTAIVDFKSGRKGFWEEHEIQLHLYKMAWEVNFPDFPVAKVYNFSPKDWRTKPTYNLKDQTDSVNAKKIPHLLALATIEDEKRENTLTIISGEYSLDDGDPLANITTLSLSELIKKRADEKEAPKPKRGRKKATTAGKASKTPVKRTKASGTGKVSPKAKKPVKTKISEK